MSRRRDAGLELVRLLGAIDARFPQICGPRTVWTTGRIDLDPGEKSIIPGKAEALFQLRDADPAVLDRLDRELDSLIERANANGVCRNALERISASTPAVPAGLLPGSDPSRPVAWASSHCLDRSARLRWAITSK